MLAASEVFAECRHRVPTPMDSPTYWTRLQNKSGINVLETPTSVELEVNMRVCTQLLTGRKLFLLRVASTKDSGLEMESRVCAVSNHT